MSNDLEQILNPKSIAVVGATNRAGSVGLAIFSNLLAGYQGVLYPVNPKAKAVHGVRAYPRLLDTPDEVDVAIIIVPAESVLPVVEEAIEKRVKGVVVISSGFKEVLGRGAELEVRLKEVVRKRGLRLIGPNCLGIINTNPSVCMNASFARKMPRPGNIAFISQSGALGTAVLDFAEGEGIGFSKFVSFGNKADVNELDLLRYLKDDPETDVILMYLEDISDGRRFIEIASEITWDSHKPILAMKSGRSPEGARAAASHTGSLAGSDLAYDALFLQSGIQRVESTSELFNTAAAFANQPMPKGNRIAVITNAGGPGIIATDAAIRHGLKLASLSPETCEKLRQHLPVTACINNPVDIIGDATHERYELAIRDILMDEAVDGGIIILTPQAMTDIMATAEIVPRVTKGINKPVLCSFMGVVDVSEGVRYLEQHGIPNYAFPEEAVRAMASMERFGNRLTLGKREIRRVAADSETAAQIIAGKLRNKERAFLPEKEANEILQCYGFPVLKSVLIKDESEIEAAVDQVGLPVAVKICSPDIVHKFEAGGVQLKINSVRQAQKAYTEILANVRKVNPAAEIKGILIERMARGGVEVILGAARDEKFGPICMFGLGGTFVEALKDVTFRLAPMWEISAELMIRSIKSYRILTGIRGIPASDIDAIKDCILRLSQMVTDHPEIAELDINPLIVYPAGKGCVVADSRILLKRVAATENTDKEIPTGELQKVKVS
ncbi:MAG: CoA-binding protein [Candidatus Abyssobacteria bacterium SURF_5]|uniref:CoA-binding protein n=1 Tax=Abyssobacteria bacterium (strain SURF_5) TaxID=2093360 RepID=A0A3A4NE21_ABYX5|nr:MAG: CoA-binding protein [Candidatus Abyssubacteria bacterium SURF_5]